MTNRSRITAVTLALVLCGAGQAAAQMGQGGTAKSLQQFQVDDLKQLKDKFVGLANAFPQDKWDWRPMEVAQGLTPVRSPREVMILIANEGNTFPVQWGAKAPAGVDPDRAKEAARLQAMSKSQLAAAVGMAFDNIIAVVSGMDAEARAKQVRFFGSPATTEVAIQMALVDMHEHLGQMIAYARSNNVIPPWSK
jgi:hypothetical protein